MEPGNRSEYHDRRHLATWLLALLLLAGVTTAYLRSPIEQSLDSYFSLQVAASLYSGDQGELRKYRPVIEGDLVDGKLRYQVIELRDGRLFSWYPIGAPLMAAPLLGLADQFDPGLLKRLRAVRMPALERQIASLLAGLVPPLFFLALRRRGFDLAVALAVGLTLAFATTLWSQASRGLWQHGPLLLTFVGLLWAVAPPRPTLRRWLLAGLCLGAGCLIRPSAGALLPPFMVLAAMAGWRPALSCATGAAVGLGLLSAYNLWAFDSIVPNYLQLPRSSLTDAVSNLAGLLLSPSRGLLVFSPVLLLGLIGLCRAWRAGWMRPLDWAILASGALLLGSVSFWPDWSGGHSYGPRLLTDILPFCLWFVAFALRDLGNLRAPARTALLGGFLLLLAVSCAIHYRGAFDTAVYYWNLTPGSLGVRAWDWADIQFLRGL